MSLPKIDLIVAGLFCLAIGCSSGAGPEPQAGPVIDFRALAESDNPEADFNQVLLRIQLLNTQADLLKYGINTPEAHQGRLNYYLFGFRDDVFLISGSDTIPCYDLHLERTYMDLPYLNFILTFNHTLATGDEILVHDRVYTNRSVFIKIEQNLNAQ